MIATRMNLAEDAKPDPILEEAMDWLLRLHDSPRDREASRQFDAWLAISVAHARAWDKARRTWQLMGEVPPAYEHLWKDDAAQPLPVEAMPSALGKPSGRRGWKAMAAALTAAAAAAVILTFAAPAILLRFEADYRTATAESRIITLSDGSTVTLGADSAIASDMASNVAVGERRVRLLSGEALFDVVRDPARRFVVEAGGVDVTVLGTVFNVQLGSTATTVELAEGSVAIDMAATSSVVATLSPGEMAVVDRRTGSVTRSVIAPDDIAAWRQGQLFVNDATIGSVIEQLQRYHPAWITMADSSLSAQRVTGLYDLRDPDRALSALVRPYGGQVRAVSPYLRVVSRL